MTLVLLRDVGPVRLCDLKNETSTMPYSCDVLFIFSGVFFMVIPPPDEDDPFISLMRK